MSVKPAELIRQELLSLHAYHVPDASGFVKLDAMENPYTLPEALRDEIARIARQTAINRYPDASASALKLRLRRAMAIPAGAELILGNGSDEIIQMLATSVARPGAVILGVEPSFVMFRLIATIVGARFVGVPLRQDFSLDEPALGLAMEKHRPALTFFAYPNNPTGNLFDREALLRIISKAPGLVVIDEAYHAFAADSFMPALTAHDNLLVMRTVSKLGLAGLRLGLLAGAAQWLREFDKVRLPYNVNVLTQAVAEAVLARDDVLDRQAAAIREERERLYGALAGVRGGHPWPSLANFILFRVPDAPGVFERLKQRKVLIKNLHGSHPRLDNCLRVTVGTPPENEAFLSALRDSLNG